MPEILDIQGKIFDSECECIVNPVNSVGVMDQGLSEQFMKLYPLQCRHFIEESKQFGRLFFGPKKQLIKPMFYRASSWRAKKSILMFPVSIFPEELGKLEHIDSSSEWGARMISQSQTKSVAFPVININPLTWDVIKPIIVKHLSPLSLDRAEFVHDK